MQHNINHKYQRYHNLDILRDICALMVVLSHISSMIYNPALEDNIYKPWANIFWNLGNPAVDIFLVLSGYVVTLSYLSQKEKNGKTQNYIISRIVRLMPVYLTSLIIALIIWSLLKYIGKTHNAGLILASHNINISELMFNILPLWHNDASLILNPPWWTINIEFIAIFFIPIITAIMINNKIKSYLLKGGLIIISYILINQFIISAISNNYKILFSINAIIMGSIFAIIKINNENIFIRFSNIMNINENKSLLIIFAIIIKIMLIMSIANVHYEPLDYRIRSIIGAFAAIIIIAVLSTEPKKPKNINLKTKKIYAGQTSYALYAIHYPILLLSVALFTDKNSSDMHIIISAIFGAIISYIFAIYISMTIDKNAIENSRKISNVNFKKIK